MSEEEAIDLLDIYEKYPAQYELLIGDEIVGYLFTKEFNEREESMGPRTRSIESHDKRNHQCNKSAK